MGTLRRQAARGAEVLSFEYDKDWLRSGAAFTLDPDLAFVPGPQYPGAERTNFGIFLDSSPDRWGRTLQQRRESLIARQEGRAARWLTDWDFLLGVHDETRLGALRLQDPGTGRWVDSRDTLAAPPITSLRDLQAASRRFEQSGEGEIPHGEWWLAQLFAPGSSLGGARPKASIRDEEGALCIAKFPSRQDRRDAGAWELVAHRLAAKAGIRVSAARGIRAGDSPYTTFVTRRFDRNRSGGRLAFVSAMNLTQRHDGEPGVSYLELVELLQSRGADAARDCEELFRRIVFSILIHNTDDHLRNHGFFLNERGITLSPAYDINPSIERDVLSLAIDEVAAECNVEIALEAHKSYGLTAVQAQAIIGTARKSVATWRREAARLRIPAAEKDLMAPAFGER